VLALFELNPDGHPSPRHLLLAQIQRMEVDLNALKALVEQMPQ
jgi:regulator of sirC expression with transglutaminase-like and TPR domain